jgi:hypothetical protein
VHLTLPLRREIFQNMEYESVAYIQLNADHPATSKLQILVNTWDIWYPNTCLGRYSITGHAISQWNMPTTYM